MKRWEVFDTYSRDRAPTDRIIRGPEWLAHLLAIWLSWRHGRMHDYVIYRPDQWEPE